MPRPEVMTLVLSAARFERYVDACGGDEARATALYGWNAQVSAAFMTVSHFAEIAVRNAAGDALTAVYGSDWPWSRAFERSLPAPAQGYSPRRDLVATRNRESTTGKVVAELKLAFWCLIFTWTLQQDLRRMLELVDLRSPDMGQWIRDFETVSQLLRERP